MNHHDGRDRIDDRLGPSFGKSSRLGWYIAAVWLVIAIAGFLIIHSRSSASGASDSVAPTTTATPRPTNLPAGPPDACLLGTWSETREIASVFGPPTVTLVGNAGGQITFAKDGIATSPASTSKFTVSGVDNDGHTYQLVIPGVPAMLGHFRAADGQIELLDLTSGDSGVMVSLYQDGVVVGSVSLDDISISRPGAILTYTCVPHTSLKITYRGTKADATTQYVWAG